MSVIWIPNVKLFLAFFSEDESNYVNIQYFLLKKDLTSGTGQSDDELDVEDDLDTVEEDEPSSPPISLK